MGSAYTSQVSSPETDTRPPTPGQVLSWWQKHHGRLTDFQRQRFLRRSEVASLSQIPAWAVHPSIASNKKLTAILQSAESLHGQGLPQSTKKKPPKRVAPAARRGKGPHPVPPVLGGTIGGGQPQGGGPFMAKAPGAIEAAIGERCSNCRAWVPSGASHDC